MASPRFPVTVFFKTLAGCGLLCARHCAGETVMCKSEKVSLFPQGAYSLVSFSEAGEAGEESSRQSNEKQKHFIPNLEW